MHLNTKNLLIRQLTMDDLDAFSSLLGNQQVMHFSVAGPLSREKVKKYLDNRVLNHYAEYGYGLWAVIHKADNRFIGVAGLLRQSIDGEELVELGYRLDPNYWAKGLATEAAQAIAQYAFAELKLDRIISLIDPKNVRSVGVAVRLGMHLWKEALFHNVPVQVYELKMSEEN